MNSSDLIHFIIKFGMLKHYPEFIKHFEDVLQNYDKKGGLRKFIEEIAEKYDFDLINMVNLSKVLGLEYYNDEYLYIFQKR